MDELRSLFEETSLQAYTDRLLRLTAKWSQPFVQYYVDNIHPVIAHIGAWELRTYGLESATTNASESFNCVLKRLQDWREAPVDCMVLSLYRLSQYYVTEITFGRSGAGRYHLRSGIPLQALPIASASTLTQPDDIVDSIRYATTTSSVSTSTPPTLPAAVPSSSSSAPTTSTASSSSPSNTESITVDQTDYATLSTTERAAKVVSSGKLSLNSQLSVFTVIGTTGEPRVVKLFPNESCSCPAQSQCYHIAAARMAIGLVEPVPRRRVNLTQLRRNKRKRPDKTAGRKRPRVNDLDVIPADDTDTVLEEELRRKIVASTSYAVINTTQNSVPQSPPPPSTSPLYVPSPPPRSPSPPPTSLLVSVPAPVPPPIATDVCTVCNSHEAPLKAKGRGKGTSRKQVVNDEWIGCDLCPRWFHYTCVGVKGKPKKFICDSCSQG